MQDVMKHNGSFSGGSMEAEFTAQCNPFATEEDSKAALQILLEAKRQAEALMPGCSLTAALTTERTATLNYMKDGKPFFWDMK